ncbi:MAG TPA: VOC family protein [Thermoanaerobaculia bacterium]|nr:VOC family protein [Thermoanaerobaculia bacterium]
MKVTSYEPGMFCWVELATTDAKAAKSFYTGLFGWKVNEIPMGDQGTYFIFQKDGNDAGAMYEQSPQEKKERIPPHWNSYISVKDADAAAKKAAGLGGQVVAGPFDVMDIGRMAFVADPHRAMFAVWQPKKRNGATVINEPGALCWNELYSSDIEASRKYYSSLFGWKLEPSPEYTEIHVGDRGVGGMMQISKEMGGMPPMWMPYFMVSDAEATCKKTQSLGGKVHKPAADIPKVGRFAVLADPQGASFAIIKISM